MNSLMACLAVRVLVQNYAMNCRIGISMHCKVSCSMVTKHLNMLMCFCMRGGMIILSLCK